MFLMDDITSGLSRLGLSASLPQRNLSPFLEPDFGMKHRLVPDCGDPRAYLSLVRHNALAEYALFVSQQAAGSRVLLEASVRYIKGTMTVEEPMHLKRRFAGGGWSIDPDGEPVEIEELHNHAVAWDGRLHIAVLSKDEGSTVLALKPGCALPACSDFPGLLDLGYTGDAINEVAACDKFLSGHPMPRILMSIADPTCRSAASYRAGAPISSAVPLNDGQRSVLEGMRFDLEGVQGPPGTGKSTLIFHLISSFLPPHGIALATCVQNKAVDAISEKLASGGLPFFVFGNDARLGLVSASWTLAAQTERDPAVVRLSSTRDRLAELSETLSTKLRLALRGPFDVRQAAWRQKRILQLHPGSTKEAVATREALQKRQPWLRAWQAVVRQKRPLLVMAARHAAKRTGVLSLEVAQLKEAVRARLIADARAVLCTVATASRSLLTDEEMEPVCEKITSAVLDEAGTSPEQKMPLLASLPRLERLVAIGDHLQLSPFTLWQPVNRNSGSGSGGGRICHNFARNGHCRFGSRCNFSHATFHRSGREDVGVEPRGFFQRLQSALGGAAVPALSVQYRMHRSIAAYISATFYNDLLITPAAVASARSGACARGLWWLQSNGPDEKPERGTSFVNDAEADAVVDVVLACRRGAGAQKGVLVITFYKGQEKLLRSRLQAAGVRETVDIAPAPNVHSLRVMSVDQAQGSEADVVILSCVRSNQERSIGFLSNPNRLNVAVSRARERLVVVGDANTLGRDAKWMGLSVCASSLETADDLPLLLI